VIEGAKGRGGIDWAVAILLGAVLAIVAILQYRKRKADALVFDTKPFTDALKVWTPIVARRYNSPRAIKRFGNRLRYFAMLQQAEEPVEEAPTDWRSRLRFRGESATASIAFKPDKARVDVVAEHRIVALGAIHEVFGDKYWRIWVTEGREPSPKPFAEPADYGDVAKAVAAYKADGRRWPPSAEELDAFERSLKGIRLDGEVAVIAETEPAPEPPRSRTPKQTPPKLKARSNSTDRGSRFVELETPVGSKERG
jgi:hypothetical protein